MQTLFTLNVIPSGNTPLTRVVNTKTGTKIPISRAYRPAARVTIMQAQNNDAKSTNKPLETSSKNAAQIQDSMSYIQKISA